QAIQEAEAASGIEINDVMVGIAGQHIRSLQNSDYISCIDSDEVINEEDIEYLCNQVLKLVMLPGEEIIHVLPQEFKVDGQGEVSEPIGMYGGRLEANFHVVVGQVASIRNVGRCVKNAGLNMSSITLEPLASAQAVLSKEEKEAGVVLLDIGGGTTDLAIFKDGIIRHTSVIPFGGNVITEDIKEGCAIIEKQAELLKIRFGSAWPGENKENEIVSIPGLRGREPKEITLKNLSRIIHARLEEIIELVYLEIKNYGHEEQKKKLIAGIVITGGGAQLRHLKQLVEYITGMDTRIGYPNEHMAGNSSEEVTSPAYATVAGLVMHGIRTVQKEKEEAFERAQEEALEVAQEEASKVEEDQTVEDNKEEEVLEEKKKEQSSGPIFERFFDRFMELLDRAEYIVEYFKINIYGHHRFKQDFARHAEKSVERNKSNRRRRRSRS